MFRRYREEIKVLKIINRYNISLTLTKSSKHVVDFLKILLNVHVLCGKSAFRNCIMLFSLYGIIMSSLDTKTEVPSILTHSPFINGKIPVFSHDINEICRPG